MTVPSPAMVELPAGAAPSLDGSAPSGSERSVPPWRTFSAEHAGLRKLFQNGPLPAAHAAWAKHLDKRRRPRAAARLRDRDQRMSPLRWGVPVSSVDEDTLRIIDLLDRLRRGKRVSAAAIRTAADEWPAAGEPASASPAEALRFLAWGYALPMLAEVLEAETWWGLLERLIRAAEDALALSAAEEPWSAQLYSGELPSLLACQFPELAACRKPARGSRRFLSEALGELLDEQGLPQARHLPALRAMAACWTRCALLAAARSEKPWNRSAQRQYEWLVQNLLRFARGDGSQAHAAEPTLDGAASPGLMAAALQAGGNRDDAALATIALPGRRPKTHPELWDAPSLVSEWGELAVLRRDWSRKSPQLHVTFDRGCTKLELLLGKRCLLRGEHDLQVTINDRPVPLPRDSRWEVVCWESDDDVDYLELEIRLESQVRVQRSYLLAREDGFLLLSDAVLSQSSGTVRYKAGLPLAGGISLLPQSDTREAVLSADKRPARVLPLALPEWRIDPRVGQLAEEDSRMVLSQQAEGSSLCAPLFIDLDRSRRRREVTWRQLTVAEERQRQPSDVAVGYRVQVGDEQWLIYRSLAPTGSRTVLGQHLTCEFLCARFLPDGTVENLISVE